jgi:hypothetical protein
VSHPQYFLITRYDDVCRAEGKFVVFDGHLKWQKGTFTNRAGP